MQIKNLLFIIFIIFVILITNAELRAASKSPFTVFALTGCSLSQSQNLPIGICVSYDLSKIGMKYMSVGVASSYDITGLNHVRVSPLVAVKPFNQVSVLYALGYSFDDNELRAFILIPLTKRVK